MQFLRRSKSSQYIPVPVLVVTVSSLTLLRQIDPKIQTLKQ